MTGMRTSRVVAAVVLGLLVVAGALLYVFAGSGALSADRRPGRLEEAVARRLVRLSIPSAGASATNPFAAGDAWRDGLDHFGDHCAMCHGADGRGAELGRSMYPPAPDLSSPSIQQFTDAQLFSIIQHGVSWTGMPAFQSTHSPEDTWKLVAFIRRVPRLTPADLDQPGGHEHDHEHDRDHEHEHGHEHGHETTIGIDGTQFQPSEVTVHAGETVVWVNKDPFPHNVVSDAGGFHSGEMAPDATWRFRPTKRGTFRYVCTLHPTMAAVLRVE
jgi:plastocyanin/mono/diheme cytochrome c family protein